MDYNQNIRKLYAIRFFHNLIPAYVIERLFWEQRGMTIRLVVYTEILYAVTVVLLEIPSGIIADKWGRKKLVIVNAVSGCCELLILIFATKFWHFAAAIFVAGVGRAAGSGAENALLYDSLLSNGDENSFEKCLGRLNALEFTAAILAALSGSFMAGRYGFELNYWISLAGMFASLCISFMLREPEVRSRTGEQIPIKDYVVASLSFFRSNYGVCLVLFSAMIAGSAMNFIDEFWQLYVSRLGIPVIYFGFFSSALSLLRLPGNMLAYRIKKQTSYRKLISGVVSVFAAGFLYLSLIR
ncbi:MAG TPA: MFS transporter, partial [Thermoclostridium sp.]